MTRLVDAATLAEHLGVTRDFVYAHADELGAIRLGTGPRGRLRFDPARALPTVTAPPPSHRRRTTATPLLAIKGRAA